MPADLDRSFVDDFQAIAVLLALAAVLFGVKYQKILDGRDGPPVVGAVARRNARRSLARTLVYDALPVAVVSGASAYLVLPGSIACAKYGSFDVWHFDLIRTPWCIAFCLLLRVFAWALHQNFGASIEF